MTPCSHISVESRQRIRELSQEIGVGRFLAGMSIETVKRYVKNAGTQIGVDELSGQLQSIGQRGIRVSRLGLVILADFLKSTAAFVSIDGGTLHKVEQIGLLRSSQFCGAFDQRALLALV